MLIGQDAHRNRVSAGRRKWPGCSSIIEPPGASYGETSRAKREADVRQQFAAKIHSNTQHHLVSFAVNCYFHYIPNTSLYPHLDKHCFFIYLDFPFSSQAYLHLIIWLIRSSASKANVELWLRKIILHEINHHRPCRSTPPRRWTLSQVGRHMIGLLRMLRTSTVKSRI